MQARAKREAGIEARSHQEMNDSLYIAVDLGAGSGRVFLGGMSPRELLLEEVHRFRYEPVNGNGRNGGNGTLRWNASAIWKHVKHGLGKAVKRAHQLKRPVSSIGVDSWGADYALIDGQGRLCENPVCYRDNRTQNTMEKVFEQVSRDEIFSRTGIQFLVFNTLFQLHAHMEAGLPEKAGRLLLIPDLIHFRLSGREATEYTNATTTQMVNAQTSLWDFDLLSSLNFPQHLLTGIVPAGTDLGALKTSVAKEAGLTSVRVVAPATHDTASAVVGTPLETGFAYISSGTWSLVGVERDRPLINSLVSRSNFTNEGGAFGTIRFLKNVMGLWILESCRKEWRENGIDTDYSYLLGQVSSLQDAPCLVFPDDPRFFNPPNMLEALSNHLVETDQPVPLTPTAWTKSILDSLAFRYASVLNNIQSLTGEKVCGIHIVGGGSRNDYLNQMTANISGLPVLAGPAEATVTGNILVQAIAQGRFRSLAEGRAHVARNLELKKFVPHKTTAVEEASRRYAAIEARWIENEAGDLIHHASR
jgi:rhamnulokinase